VLGFQEGGQIKNFQEGDMVEADGEQVIPLSSVTDEPNVVEKAVQLIKDNPVEAASIGLMFVPGIGPALGMGARGLIGLRALAPRAVAAGSRGIAALRAKAPVAGSFLTRESVQPPAAGRLGRFAQSLYSRERATGPYSKVTGSVGGTRPGPYRKAQMSGEEARRLGLPLKREFSPGRVAQTAGAGLGIAALMGGGDDEVEAARQPTPQEMLGSAVFQREDAPAAMFRAGDTSTQRRQGSRGGGQGAASRLGSALTSDKAQQLYSAFQDLGLAGGASRGFEGAQLTI
jgi:hypothetical protein